MTNTSTFDGLRWRKSSRSQGDSACVEVAIAPELVGVRDTKDRDGGHIEVSRQQWKHFTAAARGGSFDR